MEALKKSPNQVKTIMERWREDKQKQRKQVPKAKRIKEMTANEKKIYMKLKQRERRQKVSIQMKTNLKKKDKLARAEARAHPDEEVMNTPKPPSPINTPPSRSTIHRKASDAKKSMPKSPMTFASVMPKLVGSATPERNMNSRKEDSYADWKMIMLACQCRERSRS